MNSNAQTLIQVYNTLFTVCLVIAILALGLAIFIFFKCDIPSNLAIRTGHAEKVSVKKQKKKSSAKTGSLNKREQVNMDFATDELNQPAAPQPAAGVEETTALAGETAPLAQGASAVPPHIWLQPSPESAQRIQFRITENTVVIHTTEMI